jgi:hypothetical protein
MLPLTGTALLSLACWAPRAETPTWVEVGGVTYGARPDERGPIGGGEGYAAIVTGGDYVVKDIDSLVDALSKATTGQVVFIPGDAEMDLTALIYIEKLVLQVPGGVTLASDRGNAGSLGALIESDALDTRALIRALGPGVRVTGLRLEGPNPKRYLDHHRRAYGPGGKGAEYYYKLPVSSGIVADQPSLEVDNCDISGFSLAGANLQKGEGHHIHHCSIHHCQYQGLGYGVCLDTASAVIEQNLFNWNRHSIAGTGRPPSGYVARNNVELGVSLSHCFDMHGGRDRNDGTDTAGTTIEVSHNTFRAPQTPVVIRGVPQERCDVTRNWFPQHAEPAEAVHGSAKTNVFDNAYGADPKAAR